MSKKIKAEWIVRPDSYTLDHAADWKDKASSREIGVGYYTFIEPEGTIKEFFSNKGKVEQVVTHTPAETPKKKYAMISQPMGGKSPEGIKAQRDLMVEWAEKEGYEVLDTDFSAEINRMGVWNNAGDDNVNVYLLGKAIQQMALVDCVFFAWGWEKARGCCIEHEVAREYGIKCRYADEELA